MKNYIITLIILSTFSFAQESSTGNILEDHEKAVEGILSDEIKKQTEIVNKALAKQSNDVLFAQATYSFLGTVPSNSHKRRILSSTVSFLKIDDSWGR